MSSSSDSREESSGRNSGNSPTDMPALEPVENVNVTIQKPQQSETTTTASAKPEEAAVAAAAAAAEVAKPPPEMDAKTKAEIAAKEKMLTELSWDYDQTGDNLNVRVELPKDMNKVNRKALSVKVEEMLISVTIEGKLVAELPLYSKIKVGEDVDQWAITDGKDGAKVINVDLAKAEEEMWPYVVQLPLLPSPEYFLTEAEIAACRKAEVEAERKSAAAEEKDEALDEDGIQITPEEEPYASEAEKETSTEELFGQAVQQLSSSNAPEAVRLLRVLAIHRLHVPSCLTLHSVYGDSRFWGISKSFVKAMWFLRHALSGPVTSDRPSVYLTLARYYETGDIGLPQSWALAVKYYQKGAEIGHCTAISQLASVLMKGHLGRHEPTNVANSRPTHARLLIQAALRRGCPYGNVVAGDWYLRSEVGFTKDVATAKQHYERAVRWLPPIRSIVPWTDLMEASRQQQRKTSPGAAAAAAAEQDDEEVDPTVATVEGEEGEEDGSAAAASTGQKSWISVRFWERLGTFALGAFVVVDLFLLSNNQALL